jgi:hypothetical protein
MGSNPLNNSDAILIFYLNNQSIMVTFDIKNHAIISQKISASISSTVSA